MKQAIFPGSFNPFTTGHENIVRRGLTFFDKIIIAIGKNSAKNDFSLQERKAKIEEIFKDENRVEVALYQGLTIDFAKEKNVKFLLRGVRNLDDFKYELEMADCNKLLAGVETVLLFAESDKREISSTLVRELQAFGKDISDYIPQKK